MKSEYGIELDNIREDSVYLNEGTWVLWKTLYAHGSVCYTLAGKYWDPGTHEPETAIFKEMGKYEGYYVDALYWKNEKLGHNPPDLSETEFKK